MIFFTAGWFIFNESHMNKKTPSYIQVSANSRTYRFRVGTNNAGREYLSISEFPADGSADQCKRIVVFRPRTCSPSTRPTCRPPSG